MIAEDQCALFNAGSLFNTYITFQCVEIHSLLTSIKFPTCGNLQTLSEFHKFGMVNCYIIGCGFLMEISPFHYSGNLVFGLVKGQ